MPIASLPVTYGRRAIKTILGRSGHLCERAKKIASHCMTLKPVQSFIFFHLRSNPNRSQKRLVFPRVLPMKTGLWLGPESNRRHVDFQSTALPTELPSHFTYENSSSLLP